MLRVHLDTDLGGDPDDVCALAMLLGWPDVEIVGITTNLEVEGRRAACALHVLELAGRSGVPVAAGAESSLTTGKQFAPTWGDARYWPADLPAPPSTAGAALDLLSASAEAGATIVAVGAYTNLALLEVSRPGALDGVRVVLMGGWVRPPAEGMPAWGPERDFNMQCDTYAAEVVLRSGADLTLVTLTAAMHTHLRAAHLPRLQSAGAIGKLIARQAEAYAHDTGRAALARAHPGLPDDLLNFHWDPVTCAIAVGWPGASVEEMRLAATVEEGTLRLRQSPDGRPASVVVHIDAAAFDSEWLASIESLGH